MILAQRCFAALLGGFARLRNLVTDEVLARQAPHEFAPGRGGGEQRRSFNIHLLPHSYAILTTEKWLRDRVLKRIAPDGRQI